MMSITKEVKLKVREVWDRIVKYAEEAYRPYSYALRSKAEGIRDISGVEPRTAQKGLEHSVEDDEPGPTELTFAY